jgi:hypothetical protein
MAGKTATIDFQTLRVQWASHSSMFAICTHWTITKDQLIRLKAVADLPPRHDRRLRFKPIRQRDPTPREIAQSCREIQARWDAHTRHERQVTKPVSYEVREVELPPDLRTFGEGE